MEIICKELFRKNVGEKVLCSLFCKKEGEGNNVLLTWQRNPSGSWWGRGEVT